MIPARHLNEAQHRSFACRDAIRALDDVSFVVPHNARIVVPSFFGIHR